jgi:uncharacterized protein YbjQ (UPF0145 family)
MTDYAALVERLAKQAIDNSITRLRALHDYAGRPAWDAVVADEIGKVLDALVPEAAEAITTLQSQLADARAEALEEAAARAERFDAPHLNGVGERIAQAIRAALKDQGQ